MLLTSVTLTPLGLSCSFTGIWRFWTLFPSPKGEGWWLYYISCTLRRQKVLTSLQPKEYPTMQGIFGHSLQSSSPTDTLQQGSLVPAWGKAIKPRGNSLCSSVFPSLLCSPPALPPGPCCCWGLHSSCGAISAQGVKGSCRWQHHFWNISGFFGLQPRTSLCERSFSFPPSTKMTWSSLSKQILVVLNWHFCTKVSLFPMAQFY